MRRIRGRGRLIDGLILALYPTAMRALVPICIAGSLFCALAAPAARAKNPIAGKKLVEYGWDVPSTAFCRERVADMEKIAFDGVAIQILRMKPDGTTADSLGWSVFGRKKFEPSEYEHAIADLKATRFRRFTDNFVQVIAMPGEVDWFDPEWSSVAHDAGCLARVAKQGGCKGIMFDPEDYGQYHIWNYHAQPEDRRAAHSCAEYRSRVRQRGREFIRAVNKEYPDITILALYAYCLPFVQSRGPFISHEYELLPAFYDGILEAATPGTILVDGYEFAYSLREKREYSEIRDTILNKAKAISAVPWAYEKRVRVGLGKWADCSSLQVGWHPDDFSKNYYTPAGLRAAVYYALETCDEYVWVYSERLRWWDFNTPQEYVDALALAKKGPGPGEPRPLPMPPPKAELQPNYADEPTFAEMRKTMTDLMDMPKDGWLFKRDDKDEGRKLGWYAPDFDDSSWRTISIGKFWDEQGEGCEECRAWYRMRFAGPSIPSGKRVFLAFGAVDESAWVWLNGKSIGAHDEDGGGWDRPFALEVTDSLKPGHENVLAVLVRNRVAAGGIWKSVKLLAKGD